MRGRIVDLAGGQVLRTEPGTQVAYSLDGSEYVDVDVDFTLNASGRIVGATPVV